MRALRNSRRLLFDVLAFHYKTHEQIQYRIHRWGLRFQTAQTDAETIVCVAFGDWTGLVLHGCFLHARADVTLVHIWCPERAKQLSERTLAEVLRFIWIHETEARANLTCAHVWRPPKASRAF